MAYTPLTLKAWMAANPGYNAFAGTTSGKPLIYQVAASVPLKTAESWFVWDYVSEFPDLAQSPATADISTTGKTARVTIATVADAPSASDLEVFLGEDTDKTLEAVEGIELAYQAALVAGSKFFLGHFMGADKSSEVYQAGISWASGIMGTFPDPLTTQVSITPNLGGYHDKKFVITNVGG